MLSETRRQKITLVCFFLGKALLVFGCDSTTQLTEEMPWRSPDLRVGTVYLPPESFSTPTLERIAIPMTTDDDAVWGAVGRDDRGYIYFGVSSNRDLTRSRSSSLYRYDPGTGAIQLQGDSLDQLIKSGKTNEGGCQNALHSKIYQADDGYLYFSSYCDIGQTDIIMSEWGGHLWRKKPDAAEWEHLFATSEQLIAVNTNGRYVYALGYWDHVLYQFDTLTESWGNVTVGSVPGHISRNFLVADDGHAFVPRVRRRVDGGFDTTLCEYDVELANVGCMPLADYVLDKSYVKNQQGIVAYTRMRDGRVPFIVNGQLKVLKPAKGDTPARIEHKGSIHPTTVANVKSLHTFDGRSLLLATGYIEEDKKRLQWIIYELESGVATSEPIELDFPKTPGFYGSSTKDNLGALYLGGFMYRTRGKLNEPLFVRLHW